MPRRQKEIGAGVQVGLLDSGVRLPDAFPAHLARIDEAGDVAAAGVLEDPTGHGTATASLIAAGPNRVGESRPGYALRLVVGQVLDGAPSIRRVLAGLDWMVDQRVRVLALCAGLPRSNPVLAPMLEALRAHDVLVVCPAGNVGGGSVTPPGDDPSVLCVGACDRHGRRAGFSGTLAGESSSPTAPDVLAVGVEVTVRSVDGGLERRSGTSMAAARVAGVAAWLRAEAPEATAEDVRRAICTTADPDHALEPRAGSRCGRIDPEAAQAALHSAAPLPADPVPRSHDLSPVLDPRLLRQLRSAHDGPPATGIFVLRADPRRPFEIRADELVARAGPDLTVERTYPRGRALVATGPAPSLFALVDDPEVWVASAADADPLLDPLYAPETGRTVIAW